MVRHYLKNRLKSESGNLLLSPTPSIWDLSPYEVARFGGELSKVMIEASKQYIFEQCYLRQKNQFENEAYSGKTKP